MKTVNTEFTTKENLEEFLELYNIQEGSNILLQIFTGVCSQIYIKELVTTIRKLLPSVFIIGATTDGEILDTSVLEHSTVLSFTLFETTTIQTYYTTQTSSQDAALDLIAQIDKPNEAKVAISFTGNLNINADLFLEQFNIKMPQLTVAGGLAGDYSKFKNTYVFTSDNLENNFAVMAVLYNPNLTVHTLYHFGWEVIGREFIVTKAVGNRVYSIDNQTPVELYGKYLGHTICRQLPKTGIEFPLIVQRDGKAVARAVIDKKEDDSLVFAGNIYEGERVTFGYGNIKHIIANEYYRALDNIPIESIFVYSCMARKRLLGESIALELTALTNITSISGFFTYGEFYSDQKSLKKTLLNETMTMLVLSENSESQYIKFKDEDCRLSNNTQTVEALSHLVSQVTQELNELNRNLEKRVTEEIEKNKLKDQQLLHNARLARMGEMISMIAHQWRQPLSIISSLGSTINIKATLGTLQNENAVEISNKIIDNILHLSTTIDDFRDFFKPDKVKKQTSFSKILDDVFNIIKVSIINKNIQIHQELEDYSEFINYENELKQVVLNLLKNAEDVIVDKKVVDGYIKIKTYANENNIYLEISDNGGGVDIEIINRIFEPYFSTKNQKSGTGLGLYMSKVIVEEHCNGKLDVYNSDEGAVFRLQLER